MGHVIYHMESTRIESRAYKTHAAARAALTRMNRKWAETNGKLGNEPDAPQFTMGIAELDYYYKHIEKTVERTNLMTGEQYRESVNTPLHMSPSSETYWSM